MTEAGEILKMIILAFVVGGLTTAVVMPITLKIAFWIMEKMEK